MTVRLRAQRFLSRLQAQLTRPLSAAEMLARALVFAPHPDDETLACGGTIILKRRAGADLRIVWLTDGGGSHAHLLPRQALVDLRANEARRATAALGVPTEHLTFLSFPDGSLAAHAPTATEKVVDLLTRFRPTQVFLPYPRGEHPDHVATHDVVVQALARTALPCTLLEYPVWFLRHWPWVPLNGEDRPDLVRATLDGAFGLRLCQEMTAVVDVRAVLAEKRAALAHHATQIERRNGDPRWPVLGDVSDGAFLSCFFQDFERFRRSESPLRTSSP